MQRTAPAEGQVVFVQGYEFTATNVRIEQGDGYRVCRFEGICTADSRNDSIRETPYNGGTYGWRIIEPRAEPQEPKIDFSCHVCGVACPVAPNPPERAVCEDHCPDHDYQHDPWRRAWHCTVCDKERDPNWFDD